MIYLEQYISTIPLAFWAVVLALVIVVDLWRTLRLFLTQRWDSNFSLKVPKGHNFLRKDVSRLLVKPTAMRVGSNADRNL